MIGNSLEQCWSRLYGIWESGRRKEKRVEGGRKRPISRVTGRWAWHASHLGRLLRVHPTSSHLDLALALSCCALLSKSV
jgi:hypothetical protein